MANSKISDLTATTSPADTDNIVVVDNTAVETKKMTWAYVKSVLKTYFDTVYGGTYVAGENMGGSGVNRTIANTPITNSVIVCDGAVILHPTDDVFKASIISRRGALGMVHHIPREEIFTSSRERILANIKVSLGGYLAEKIKFGVTSDGVSADFREAMILAHNMVWKYGMGNNGFLGDFTAIPDNEISDKLREQLNEETNQIIKQCAKEVEELFNRESEVFERFAQELIKKDELEYDEIDEIFAEYGKSHEQLAQQGKVAYKKPNKNNKPTKK